MATVEELAKVLVSKGGYGQVDAFNAARGARAGELATEFGVGSVTSDVPVSTVPSGGVSAAPLPTAPAGGFQQGGWYNGRQYWNNTFSQPGQQHPESMQPGAGTMVSPEILAATSTAAGLQPGANQAYINSQYAGANQAQPGAAGMAGVYAGGAGVGTANQPLSALEVKVNEIQTSINAKKAEADKRRAEVNDNPFLSEASRVGRIAKIDSMLNDSLQTDNENLLYYQKQLDAEKTAATEAAKTDYAISTETDNAGNVTVITVDKKTGKLVSSISAGKVGKAAVSTGAETITDNFQHDASVVDWVSEGGKNWSPFEQLIIKYAPTMTLQQIYQEYAKSTLGKKYGSPTESPADMQTLYDKARGSI